MLRIVLKQPSQIRAISLLRYDKSFILPEDKLKVGAQISQKMRILTLTLCFVVLLELKEASGNDQANVEDPLEQDKNDQQMILTKKSFTKHPKKAHRCGLPLGMEDGRILDHQITASSSKSKKSGPNRGRLGTTGKNGAWTGSSWLQIDLGDVAKVTKVATQGRYDADEWVRRYRILYSIDGFHWTYYKDHRSSDKYFSGNTDRNTVVTNVLSPSIYARYIRFVPHWAHKRVSMRVEVYGCRNVQRCMVPLGMEDKRIPDNAIKASHLYSSWHPYYGRLNYANGWCTTSGSQYLQIDLGDVKTVTKVATQGRQGSDYRTKSYFLTYSIDGIQWEYYRQQDSSLSTKFFPGNSYTPDSIHTNTLEYPIVARYVRFRPQHIYGWYCLRVELYGCKHVCSEPLGAADYRIKDNELSSPWGGNPSYARLSVHYGWVVSGSKNRYLQVDLRTIRKITGVATQGHYSSSYWVSTYRLSYSLTGDGRQYVFFNQNGVAKVFHGNNDRYTIVRNSLHPAIYARYVRFWPVTWNGKIALRIEVYGCRKDNFCSSPVGIEDKRVVPGAMTASSAKNSNCSPNLGRLNSASAWCPKLKKRGKGKSGFRATEWLQIHLPRLTVLSKVATQGNQAKDEWTTSYRMMHSMDGRYWDRVRNPVDGEIMVFNGNSDKSTVVINDLLQTIVTRYVRIVPLTFHKTPAMRVELFGCHNLEKAPRCVSPLGMENGQIRSSELRASSSLSAKHDARFSRIHTKRGDAWCSKTNDSKQWLEIDLQITKTVTKIALQGVPKGYVKSYTISFGVSEHHWTRYKQNGKVKVFLGNYNADSFVTQEINPSIHARFIRIQPTAWHGRICLRTELYGCLVEGIGE